MSLGAIELDSYVVCALEKTKVHVLSNSMLGSELLKFQNKIELSFQSNILIGCS